MENQIVDTVLNDTLDNPKQERKMEILRKARRNKELTIMDVARSLKVWPQFIANLEKGASPVPPKKVKPLAKLYDLDPMTIVNAVMDKKRADYLAEAGLE